MIALTAVLAVLVGAVLMLARAGTAASAREGRGGVAIQAADAGVNRYVSRLVEDPRYWDHYVDQAEDPRIDPGGTAHPPGSRWTPGTPWTYSGPAQTWTTLQDARFGRAAYSLRVFPPALGSDLVTVQSVSRVAVDGPRPLSRAVQAQIHPTSIADFQMISNATIKYGAGATTTGKLYSALDVNHEGIAKAPVYAQHLVCANSTFSCSRSYTGSDHFRAGAYDSTTTPSFRDKFPTPVDFSHFTLSLLDIKDAAEAQGIARNDPRASAWLLQFLANGSVRIHRVTNGGDLGRVMGTIGCPETVPLPQNGALYFEQSVIVSDGTNLRDACSGAGPRESVVNGRATVATKGNVYVGGNVRYGSDDDVLGLMAAGEVVITEYTPRNLYWRAASLAQTGQWRTNRGDNDGKHDTMTYVGSQTTADGGYASMFHSRIYSYDDNLQYLRPPFYPILEGSWTMQYWREVTPP